MSERAATASLLIALALTMPLPAAAQTSQSALTAAERAQREADRVFDIIKFHTIRSKPAADTGNKPSRPVSRPARPTAVTASAAAVPTEATESSPSTAVAGETAAPVAVSAPAAPQAQVSLDASASAIRAPEAEAEPEADEQDEVPLRIQSFVAPVLTPALQATLGAGSRQVRVRLTVEADGTVSHAEAAAGVPRRLAKPATDAILQWQFAPLPQARTADVDISFRRD